MDRRSFISVLAAASAMNAASSALATTIRRKTNLGLSLSEVSTVNSTYQDDLRIYKAAGFDAIGIWEFKLPGKEMDHQLVDAFHIARLRAATCVPVVSTILPGKILGKVWGPLDPARRVALICESIRRFAPFNPLSLLVISGPLGSMDPDCAHRVVVDGLREIADAARSAGVRVGLEPIHPMQRKEVSFVNSIADAMNILNHKGLEDIGIMADTFNMWYEDPADLATVAHRVIGLQVADMPMEAGRTDRVLPLEGGRRSVALTNALLNAGWNNGYLDVEIFSTPERFWGLPLDEAARDAYASADRMRTLLA